VCVTEVGVLKVLCELGYLLYTYVYNRGSYEHNP
jgi:hypothetical protein